MPVYVDNAANRKLGRVGKEKGTKSAPKKKPATKKKKYNDTFENHEGKIISRKDWMKENKNSKHYKYYLKLLFERE